MRGRSGKPCSAYPRARGDFVETHRAPFFEHCQSRVQRTGDHRRIEPVAFQRLILRRVPVDGGPLGRPPLASDGRDLAFALRINQREALATETIQVLLDHAAGEHRGDSGVEGVSAAREDLERGGGGQRVGRGDSAVAAHDRRAACGEGARARQRGKEAKPSPEAIHNPWPAR